MPNSSKRSKQNPNYPTRWSEWEWNMQEAKFSRYRIDGQQRRQYEYFHTPERTVPNKEEAPEDFCGGTWSDNKERMELDHATEHTGDLENGEKTLRSDESFEENSSDFKADKMKKFWKAGRVFMTVWTEPNGASKMNTSVGPVTVKGNLVYSKIRRFIAVTDNNSGACSCIPVITYRHQGATKKGIATILRGSQNPHAICHQGTRSYPSSSDKETTSNPLTKINEQGKLAKRSFISHGGTYYVENNAIAYYTEEINKAFPTDFSEETNLPFPMKDTFILEDEDGNVFTCVPDNSFLHPNDTPPRMSEGRTIAMNATSGLGMASTFIWLDNKMGLRQPSNIMDLVINTCKDHIPDDMKEVLGKVPAVAIFGGFVVATAIFTATTFTCLSRHKSSTQIVLGYLSFGLWMLLSLILGVNVEEAILICLPLGIIFGTLFGRLCKRDGPRHMVFDEEAST